MVRAGPPLHDGLRAVPQLKDARLRALAAAQDSSMVEAVVSEALAGLSQGRAALSSQLSDTAASEAQLTARLDKGGGAACGGQCGAGAGWACGGSSRSVGPLPLTVCAGLRAPPSCWRRPGAPTPPPPQLPPPPREAAPTASLERFHHWAPCVAPPAGGP